MRATLDRMGLKYSFLRWVSLFHTQVQSAVIVNGHISHFFSLSRGVRQGCPLSLLLYVLVAETLAVNIRCNPRSLACAFLLYPRWYLRFISMRMILRSFYQGMTQSRLSSIFIPCMRKLRALDLISPSLKVCGWVGQPTPLGWPSKSPFTPCLRKLRALDLISPSLKVCGWVGRLNPPVALDWSPSKLKILGIYVGFSNLDEDNWGPRVCAVEKTLPSWRQRNLSFRGKALVINALALSRIWYVVSCCMLIFLADRLRHGACS